MAFTLQPSPGTISLTNGSATISGTGTGFLEYRTGYLLLLPDGLTVELASDPTSDTEATAVLEWGGSNVTDSAYQAVARDPGSEVALQQRIYNQHLSSTDLLGVPFGWKFHTTTSESDPGSGYLRLNNATAASATELYVSDIDANDNDVGAWLGTLLSSQFTIRSAQRPNQIAVYSVTAVSDQSGWHKLTISAIDGDPSLLLDEEVIFNAGLAGPRGNAAGIKLAFSDTTSKADPGAGIWRADNATEGSITKLYVDNVDQYSVDITSFLDALDDVTNAAGHAVIRFQNTADESVWIEFKVTGTVVDETGYRTVPVSYVAGALPTDGDVLGLTWSVSGEDGKPVGYRLTFDDGTSDANPGAGAFRADNATFGSITKLWINDADLDTIDLSTLIEAFDDNVNANARGYITLQGQYDPSIKMEFAVTGTVTDKTGYYEIPISPVAGAVPTAGDILSLSFSASGADGTDGADGGGLKGIAVRAASTTNIDLSTDLEDGDSAGGVTLATGNVFGAFGQTDLSENGIYVVQATGAAVRHTSFDTWDEIAGGLFPVREGTYAGTIFENTDATGGGTIDTNDLTFVHDAGAPENWADLVSDATPPATINALVIGDSLMVGREAGGREDWATNLTLWNNPNDVDTDDADLGTAFVAVDIDEYPFDDSNNNLGIQAVSNLAKTFPTATVKGVVISCGGKEFDDFVDSSSVKGVMYDRMDAIIPLTGVSTPFDVIFIHLGTNNDANGNLGVVATQAANLVSALISSGYATSSTPIIFGQSSQAYPDLNPILETVVDANSQLELAYTSLLPANVGHFLGYACYDAGWQYVRALSRVPSTSFTGILDPDDLGDANVVMHDNNIVQLTTPAIITDSRRKGMFIAGKYEEQTATSNTLVKVVFPWIEFPNENYDATLSRWTPEAGPILIGAAAEWTNITADTSCSLYIYKNGGEWRRSDDRGPTVVWKNFSEIDLASGEDYYEVYTKFIHGGTGAVHDSINRTRFFGIEL